MSSITRRTAAETGKQALLQDKTRQITSTSRITQVPILSMARKSEETTGAIILEMTPMAMVLVILLMLLTLLT